jgi:hypothetical protein
MPCLIDYLMLNMMLFFPMSNLYIVMTSPSLSIVLKSHNNLLIYYIVSSHDIVSLEMVYVGWVFW